MEVKKRRNFIKVTSPPLSSTEEKRRSDVLSKIVKGQG
jgi:hypothetical protein